MTDPAHDLTREATIDAIAKVLAGLQVPLSMAGQMPGGSNRLLGAADEPYRALLAESGFGWRDAADFATWLHKVLDPPGHPVPGYCPAVHHVALDGDTNLTVYVDELYVDKDEAESIAVALAERLGLPLDDHDGLISTNYVPRKVR
jgi:hypothetical protein